MINNFVAGVDLAATRLSDGTLKDFSGGHIIEEWPDTFHAFGKVFSLENIEYGKNGYECAQYA